MSTWWPHVTLPAVLAVTIVAAGHVGADVSLVANGRSEYEIFVDKDALPITLRAADDLKLYVRKSTGADLPIRKGDALGQTPAVLVGDSPASRALGVGLDGVPPEGFHIKTVGKHLVIAGRDTAGSGHSVHWRSAPQAGTWHGVARLLEREFGIRWFAPGDDGELVPRLAAVTIKDQDFTDAPRMIYRRISYLYDNDAPPARRRDVDDWCRRNGAGWSLIWSASHVWIEFFKGETYFKDHPDWFALVNGRRLAHKNHGLQMCTTSPEALDEFARVIIEHGKQNPDVMFSLSPNDGGGFCDCDRCRSLDRERLPSGLPVLSDRICAYANEVAQRVTKALPDQTFGLYAYSYYSRPPTYVKLHPNVYVMNVLNETGRVYWSEAYRIEHLQKELLPWRKMVNNFFFYTHPEGNGNMDLPSMHPTVIEGTFRNLSQAKAQGLSLNVPDSFAGSGLNYYLYLKMAWNPEADFQALYADALERCYGTDAAPFVRRYVDLVERRSAEHAKSALAGQNVAMGVVRTFPALLDTVYAGLHEEGRPLLEKALAAAADPGQRARVSWLLDNLEYTRMTVDLYALSKIRTDAKPTVSEVRKVRDLCLRRLEDLKSKAHTNLHNSGQVESVSALFYLPFKPEVYERILLEAAGGKSRAVARKAAAPPRIDGDLSDACWKDAEEMSVAFHHVDGAPALVKTIAKAAWDEKALYLGVHCEEPLVNQIKDTVLKRDGEVWNENEIEFFMDTRNDQKVIRQLLVNSLGTIADFRHDDLKQSDWDSQAQVAVKKAQDSWTLEAAIPLAALDLAEIVPGDVWGFNVCRVRPVIKPQEYMCWSPTFGLFLQPKRFGYLVFR